MNQASRRKVLAVAGTGAAAGVVGLAAGPASARSTQGGGSGAQESVVAYVEGGSSDEIVLMVGEDEVVVHDIDLVNRILAAAGGR